VSANGTPGNPWSGFYQHGEARRGEFCPCGSRVKWRDLPEALRDVVLAEYCAVWEIEAVVDRYGNVVKAERQQKAK
jgi:hypothetical protein